MVKKKNEIAYDPIRTLSQLNFERESMAAYLGKSYGGRRKLYDTLGYPKTIQFNDYMGRYRRQDIAKACINIPVKACWRKPPIIMEGGSDQSPFEKESNALLVRLRRYFSRVDRLAGIGTYGVLFFGVDDSSKTDTEVKFAKGRNLTYLIACSEDSASIVGWNEDNGSPRMGLPEMYEISTRTGNSKQTLRVHWSRVIHVPEEPLESDVFGTPQLEAIYNRLQDIEAVSGGSAEMFWRGAAQGMAFILDKDAKPSDDEKKKFKDQIDSFYHDMERALRLKGMTVQQLAPQIADPRGQIEILTDLVCAERRIPKRIMFGSEQGQLASGQDEENWAARVLERQLDHCEPIILRQSIDRFIDIGVLPKPSTGSYTVKWQSISGENRLQSAQIALSKSQAIAAYTRSVGADRLVPIEVYLGEILGLDESTVNKVLEIIANMPKKEIPEKEVPVGTPGNGNGHSSGKNTPIGDTTGRNRTLPIGTWDGKSEGGAL